MISARLRQNRKPGGRGRGRPGGGTHGMSSLIPMIDMLTILVVYLLVHAADYEILPNTRSIQIPQSMSETKPRETVVIMISRDEVLVQGEIVARVADIERAADPEIGPVSVRLAELKDSVIGLSTQAVAESHEVTVLADKGVPFSVVKKVLATCTGQGYTRVSLAVVKKTTQSA